MATQNEKYDFTHKVVLVGDNYVGKSSLLVQFIDKKFIDLKVTIGVDAAAARINIDGKVIMAVIWDTAGGETYRELYFRWWRGAAGLVFVYDITNRESYMSLERWLTDTKLYANTNNNIMLVGNKCDRIHHRVVSTDEAKRFAAKHGFSFIETSAKDSTNVETAFRSLLTDISCRMATEKYDCLFKVVLAGDSGVGKSCLLSRFIHNECKCKSTPGMLFKSTCINIDGRVIKALIWDTVGQETFRRITGARKMFPRPKAGLLGSPAH